jgi:hypothetical protein
VKHVALRPVVYFGLERAYARGVFDLMRTSMSQNRLHSLSAHAYAEILTYILRMNSASAGEHQPIDSPSLESIARVHRNPASKGWPCKCTATSRPVKIRDTAHLCFA